MKTEAAKPFGLARHIIMEDLRGVQSGYFFGPYSPLNWGKDLEKAEPDLRVDRPFERLNV